MKAAGGGRLKYPISLSNLLLVIQIRPLRLARRTKIPVKDASLPLDPGWTIGLTGGSGKASPLRCGAVSRTRAAAISRRAMHLCWRDVNPGRHGHRFPPPRPSDARARRPGSRTFLLPEDLLKASGRVCSADRRSGVSVARAAPTAGGLAWRTSLELLSKSTPVNSQNQSTIFQQSIGFIGWRFLRCRCCL